MLYRGLLILVGCSLLAPTSPGLAETPQKNVDLELFESSEIDRNKGCSVVLWQSDRNPETEKYAYLFDEALIGQNYIRQPARIKIGGEVKLLKRVATGGNTTGYKIFEYQLYQLPEANEFVIIELKLAEMQLQSVDIESGKLTVIMDGRPTFRVSVNGKAGCMTAEAAAPTAEGNTAASGSRKASPSTPRSALVACLEAAKSADIPTTFDCDWKMAVQSTRGAKLSGEYKLRAKGADGVMTILEPDDGPAYVGIETVRLNSMAAVCGVGMGALRDDKNQLVAILDDPEKCEVHISKIPDTMSVQVTTTNECNPHLCGNGVSFDGRWALLPK